METFGAAPSTTAAPLAPPPPAPTHGVALDPYRPHEITAAPGTAPPNCPLCKSLLHWIASNEAGDHLFECLIDGYETVYRTARDVWEPRPRPNLMSSDWTPPTFGAEAAVAPAAPAPSADAVIQPTTAKVKPAKAKRAASAAAAARLLVSPPPPAVAAPAPTVEDAVDWLTLRDAADIAGTTPNALYLRVKRGTLASKRSDEGHVLVRADQLGVE